MKNVFIYGAGDRAELGKNHVINLGYNPVGYIDKDINKQNRELHGLDVMSFDEARNMINSESYIYVSPLEPIKYEIIKELVENGISKDLIINFEDVEYYPSCYYIEHSMIVTNNEMYTCCYLGDLRSLEPPKIKMNDDIESSVDTFFSKRFELIEKHKCGEKTECFGCPELKSKYWEKEKKIKSLAYFAFWPCQLRCDYCNINHLESESAKKEIEFVNSFDYTELIKYLDKTENLDDDAHIEFSAGEITLNPHKEKVFTKLKNYPAILFSNGIIYDEQIQDIIQKSDSFLVNSLDCGTRETYLKMKKSDSFDTVVSNLANYTKNGGNVEIKYIVTDANTSEDDLIGFVNVCRECNIKRARISCDTEIDHDKLSDDVVSFAIDLSKKLIENNIEVLILPHFGSSNNKKILKEVFDD